MIPLNPNETAGWTGSDLLHSPAISNFAIHLRFCVLNVIVKPIPFTRSDWDGHLSDSVRGIRLRNRRRLPSTDRLQGLGFQSPTRLCNSCIQQLFHSDWFDCRLLTHCPIHNEALTFRGAGRDTVARDVLMPFKTAGEDRKRLLSRTYRSMVLDQRQLKLQRSYFAPLSRWLTRGLVVRENANRKNVSFGRHTESERYLSGFPGSVLTPSYYSLVLEPNDPPDHTQVPTQAVQGLNQAMSWLDWSIAAREAKGAHGLSVAREAFAYMKLRCFQQDGSVTDKLVDQVNFIRLQFSGTHLNVQCWKALFLGIYRMYWLSAIRYELNLASKESYFPNPSYAVGQMGSIEIMEVLDVFWHSRHIGFLVPKPFNPSQDSDAQMRRARRLRDVLLGRTAVQNGCQLAGRESKP